MKKLLDMDVFGCVRSMAAFRPVGDYKDYLIIGSDSGRIAILKYHGARKTFEKVFQKTIYSSANCKAPAVQYLAVSGEARAVMIGTLENMKHVYVFDDRATKKHPLQLSNIIYNASTENSLIYDIVAVEDYDNPQNVLFACVEAKYKDTFPNQKLEVPKQFIAFYQLNTKDKSFDCIPLNDLTDRGNFLISVPKDRGILLCALNCITYHKMNHPVIRCPIPRRLNEVTKRSMIFVCATTCKINDTFFFLVQTEQGDIFRVTLKKDNNMVIDIQLKYFTTVDVASALCFLNSGYLFVAAEFGNHILYEIILLEDDGPEFSSSMCLDQDATFFFLPVALKNLIVAKEMESLSPIMQLEMMNPSLGKEHLLVACGRGQSSTIRILQRQLKKRTWFGIHILNTYSKVVHCSVVPILSEATLKTFKQLLPSTEDSVWQQCQRVLNYEFGCEIFNRSSEQTQKRLEYTPRKFNSLSSNIILIEADHNACTWKTRGKLSEEIMKELTNAAEKYNKLFDDEKTLRLVLSGLLWRQPGEDIPNLYQSESGMWASAIRVLELQTNMEVYKEEFEQNEAACSLSIVKFGSQKDVPFLLVGVVNKMELGCNIALSGRIYTYKMINCTLEFIHKTVVEDCPSVICPFRGHVLIGVGSTLKMYDFSEEMLYVKYEVPNLCNRIISIHNVMGDNNIYVVDDRNGLFHLLYKNKDDGQEGTIEILAEAIDPAWITTTCLWGNDKLARADKFGNILIVRLPNDSFNEESCIPAVITEILPQKYETKFNKLATFHVGEIVCSLEVGDFSSHQSSEVLVYATLSGSIGILAPIKEDEVPLLHFEMLMRVINPPLCGGDHLAFRSSYYPLLNVIDGDFLEQFYSLSDEQKEFIKNSISKSPSEMLEELRKKYLG